ncbi:MAG: hypothetical protein ACI8UD_000019 [Planctomycetota bacterium]|jgi:hypothetical protein
MSDLAIAKQWCDEARKILNLTALPSTNRSVMGARGDEIIKLLGDMEEDDRYSDPGSDGLIFKAAHDANEQLFKDLTERAAGFANDSTKSKSERKSLVLAVSQKLSVLKNELRALLGGAIAAPKLVGKQEAQAAALIAAKQRYADAHGEVEQWAIELKSMAPVESFDTVLRDILLEASLKPKDTAGYTNGLAVLGTAKSQYVVQKKLAADYVVLKGLYEAGLAEAKVWAAELEGKNRPAEQYDTDLKVIIASAEGKPETTVGFTQALALLATAKSDYAVKTKLADEYVLLKGHYDTALLEVKKWAFDLGAQNVPGQPAAAKYDFNINSIIAAAKAEPESTAGCTAALGALVLAKADYAAKLKAAEKDRDDALVTARDKPIYLTKVARIDRAIGIIQTWPGVKEQVQALKDLLQVGVDELGRTKASVGPEGDYRKAYKKLAGVTKITEQARRAANDWPRAAGGKEFPPARDKAKQALSDYFKVARLSDPEGVDEFDKHFRAIHSELEAGIHTAAEAVVEMNKLVVAVEASKSTANSNLSSGREALKRVLALILKVREQTQVSEFQAFLVRFRVLEAKAGAMHWTAATMDAFDVLESELQASLARVGPSFTAWKEAEKNVKDNYFEQLRSLASGQGGVEHLVGIASRLNNSFITAQQDHASNEHDYAKAAAEANAVIQEFDSKIKPALTQFEALEPNLVNRQKQWAAAWTQVQALVDKLADDDGDPSKFQAQLTILEKERGDDLLKILRTDAETAAKEVLLTQVDAQASMTIIDLGKEIETLIATPAAFAAHKKVAASEALAEQVAASLKTVRTGLNYLAEDEAADPTAPNPAKALGTDLTKLAADHAAAVDLADADAKTVALTQVSESLVLLDKRIEAQVASNKELIKAKSTAMRAKADTVGKQLKKAKKDFGKFKGLFTELDERLGVFVAVADSTLLTVLTQCGQGLDVLASELTAMTKEEVAKVETAIADLRGATLLDHEHMKECSPGTREALLSRLTAEQLPEAYGLTPQQAIIKVLAPFKVKVEKAKAEATAAHTVRVKILADADELAIEVAKLPGAGSLIKALNGRLDGCKTPGEGQEADSRQKLTAIAALVAAYAANPESLLTAERIARTIEQDDAIAGPALDARIKVFGKTFMKRIDVAKAKANPKDLNAFLFDEAAKAFKDAKKFAKQGNLAGGSGRLDEAERLAKEFLANPQNQSATARADLKQVEEKWKQAMVRFRKMIEKLCKEIEAEALVDATDCSTAVAALGKLPWLFNADAFGTAVKNLTGDLPEAARRKAKEGGLRQLGRYQRIVKDEPMIKHAIAAPFSSTVTTSDLVDRMYDLEVNLRRA